MANSSLLILILTCDAVQSFVDSGNNGLDGVIPRSVLEQAKGFAIFTIVKAGFIFSARAGSGIVIAKLDDGSKHDTHIFRIFIINFCAAWSAPSAIGTAGVGFGGQAGAEVTDFLVVLNSKSVSVHASCELPGHLLDVPQAIVRLRSGLTLLEAH